MKVGESGPDTQRVRLSSPTWGRFRRLGWSWQTAAWVFATPIPISLWAVARPLHVRLKAMAVAVLTACIWAALGVGLLAASQDRSSSDIGVKRPATTPGSWSAPSTSSVAITTTSTTPPSSLAGLRVEPERPRSGYHRGLFKLWTDADHDGCDTRDEVLKAESLVPAQPERITCRIISGEWLSAYEGVRVTDPSLLDVDHVVPLGEAWASGADTWSAERRELFANDLGFPRTLIAVTVNANRAKGDSGTVTWKPPLRSYWCTYAEDWVAIKVRWGLTADPAEVVVLAEMLATCPGS